MLGTLLILGMTLVEPCADGNGEPLTDLAECTVTGVDSIGRVETLIIPASSPTGCQRQVFDPLTQLSGVEGAGEVYGTCADLFGGVSEQSNRLPATFPVVPPAAPTLEP